MPDLDKLYEKAEKYLQKQKFESALETFLEIYKYQPNDEEVLLTLGDLSLKLNRTADASRFQLLLVDQYIKRNDVTKAIAACRKVLKTSPQDVATLVKMAGLLEKSHQNSDALKAYREALNSYRSAGGSLQAIDCLQHIVKFEPNDLEAHLELGELASRTRQPKIATPAFLQAARLAHQAGQDDRWSEFVERAYQLDSSDEGACLARGELYLKKGQGKEAGALVEPIAQAKPDDLAVLELLVKAYLQTRDFAKAEPLCWKLYQARPETVDLVLALADGYLQTGGTRQLLDLLGKLKSRFFQQGKRTEFLQIVEKVFQADEGNLEVLETLTNLYNELNKEDGLRRSLTRLFNLYLAAETYDKAADALERILDVDPYGEGHYDRLLSLEGHIDATWYKNILARVEPPSGGRKAAVAAGAPGAPSTARVESLEELIIEGEMYHQYQLSSKLTQTLEKINQLYPGAEESHPRLRDLYDVAGFRPKAAAGTPAAAPAAAPPVPKPAPAPPAAAPSLESLADFRKISEITANIHRESTPQGVMQTVVNELGRALNASRCWGSLGAADRPPALTVEYCSPTAGPSDIAAVLKLYAALMRRATTNPDGWSVEDFSQFPLLAPVLPEIQKLGIKSLLALPLIDRDEAAGLVLLEQCDQPRAWTPSDTLFLKAIAPQVVIAVNNTKLRRMVRALAGTEEETGLLPRSSYIDCFLSEARRAKDLARPLSVCLLEPENPAGLLKAIGDAGVQRYMQQFSKTVQSNLRQNDVSIRYSPCSIAVIFPDTNLAQGGLAVEKLRRIISQIKTDASMIPSLCSVVCDVPLGSGMDAVDGVTEAINRLEGALDQARKEGGKRVLLSKFEG